MATPRILAAEADFATVPRIMVDCSSISDRFPSSYLAGRGFSAVATLVTKKRNRLHVLLNAAGDLWLFLSKIEPDINKLLKMHQIQPSH